MIQPSRSRHGRARRALALWLMAAQVILFSAAGLTHSHVALPGATARAGAESHRPAASSTRECVQALADNHQGGAAHCAICQVARSAVAATAAAQRVAVHTTLCGQPATDLPIILPISPIGPCSTRAPPLA